MTYIRFGSKTEGDSPRSDETEMQEQINNAVLVSVLKENEIIPKAAPALPEETPVTDSLPHAFRKSRPLYAREIEYLKKIFGPSLDYNKIRITRDHWLSYGSTRVTGNTINFTSFYAGEPLFEDVAGEPLTRAGLDLLGHEAMHVWQYQNGGWAYAADALFKQAAGYYSTGSRNTAYDWQTAIEWDIPWNKWGPEQQAQAIDDWNLASRKHKPDKELIQKLHPFVVKVRQGEGAVKYSIPGIVVSAVVLSGIGYLIKKLPGVYAGLAIAILLNLPWNHWKKKKD